MSAEGRAPARLEETLELLEGLERAERIEALIGLAGRFREVPERLARRPFPAERRVPACESEAYVWSETRADGSLAFHFAVENPQGISAKALAVLLAEGLAGAPAAQIAELPVEIVERAFGRELSMGKSMGLAAMVQFVRREARLLLAEVAAGR